VHGGDVREYDAQLTAAHVFVAACLPEQPNDLPFAVSFDPQHGRFDVSIALPSSARVGAVVSIEAIVLGGSIINTPLPIRIAVGYSHARSFGGAVYDAVRAGSPERVERALVAGGSTEEYGVNQRTCLHAAIEGKHDDIVDVLIAAQADVTALTAQGQSPLHLAVGRGSVRMVNALLSAGASLDAGRSQPYVLSQAVSNGFAEADIVRALLAAGADPNHSQYADIAPHGSKPTFTCVHVAAQHANTPDRLACLVMLLQAGGDATRAASLEDGGATPLHLVTTAAAANVLIAAGANVNAPDWRRCTPLHTAASVGCLDVVRALLVAGAVRAPMSRAGHTPADLAMRSRSGQVARALQGGNACVIV
jgi:ankyrin repeat protein